MENEIKGSFKSFITFRFFAIAPWQHQRVSERHKVEYIHIFKFYLEAIEKGKQKNKNKKNKKKMISI